MHKKILRKRNFSIISMPRASRFPLPAPKGFTLVEIIVVIGIFGILFGVAVPYTLNSVFKTRLEGTAKDLAYQIYSVQQKAYTGSGNTDHGLKLETTKFTVYQGVSFTSGTNKEETILNNGIEIKTINLTPSSTEFRFLKGNLKPTHTGNIVLSDNTQTYIVEINRQGLVTYYKQ